MSWRHILTKAGILLALAGPLGAGVEWSPVGPEDIAAVRPASDPDAPAIILSWSVNVDDSDFPEEEKIVEELRYKIFDPEKAAALTRLSALSISSGGSSVSAALRARLTQPDGQTQAFGDEAVRETSLMQSGAEQGGFFDKLFAAATPETKEKYLAVPGLREGSILDVRIEQRLYNLPSTWDFVFRLQKASVPVRSTRWKIRLAPRTVYKPSLLLANGGDQDAKYEIDERHNTLVVTGSNLPALVAEPFSTPVNNRSVTLFGSYAPINEMIVPVHPMARSIRLSAEDGPWALIANRIYLLQEDGAYPESATARLERTVVAGASTDEERARRIHNYVHGLYERFRRSRRNRRQLSVATEAARITDLPEFEKYPDEQITPVDFQWLEIGLFRAAGFQADTLLLPDKEMIRFDPARASDMFVRHFASRVLVDGAWRYSMVLTPAPVCFDQLPWQFRGQSAVVVREGRQELVDIPDAPAAATLASNVGDFALGPDGSLAGTVTQTLTGDLAYEARLRLGRVPAERRRAFAARGLRVALGFQGVKVRAVDGVDDPSAPVVLAYEVAVPDYAVVTGRHLILKPSFFKAHASSPFSATARRNDVEFPFKEQEIDTVTIRLPEGYALEAPSAPVSSPGKLLSYKVSIGYSKTHHFIRLTRDYLRNLDGVRAAFYPQLKGWLDRVSQSDQHELVLVKTAPAASAVSP